GPSRRWRSGSPLFESSSLRNLSSEYGGDSSLSSFPDIVGSIGKTPFAPLITPRCPAASSCVGLIRTPSHSGHALREPIPEVHARNQRILTGSIQDLYHNIQWPRYKSRE